MSLVLTTDADLEIPAGATTNAFFSFESYGGGAVDNDYFFQQPIDQLLDVGNDAPLAETTSPIIGTTSLRVEDASDHRLKSPDILNVPPPMDVYFSWWADIQDRSITTDLMSFRHSVGSEFAVDYDGSNVRFFPRSSENKQDISLPPGAAFFEVWTDSDAGTANLRLNAEASRRFELAWLGMKDDTHFSVLGYNPASNDSTGTTIFDNILIEMVDGNTSLTLPTWSNYLYNGGSGRTKTEIENNVLV